MCYDTAQLAFKIYKEAKRLNASDEEVEELYDKWKRLEGTVTIHYHASGFNHPKLLAFSKENQKLTLDTYSWGLIPSWIKDEPAAAQIINKTLLARGEEMAEKPSYREAVRAHRCILPLDGFYEHFHKNGRTYPHYIQDKAGQRLLVGGLTSEWRSPVTGEIQKTLSIVTTKANEFMRPIHNNPKIIEPRMPLILEEQNVDRWLGGDSDEVSSIVYPNKDVSLISRTVSPLRGRLYKGNCIEVQKERLYDELINPLELF